MKILTHVLEAAIVAVALIAIVGFALAIVASDDVQPQREDTQGAGDVVQPPAAIDPLSDAD
jgi:hypothetical protein